MAEIKPFLPVKLICGLISREIFYFKAAQERLVELFGPIDLESSFYPFNYTNYYNQEMGPNLRRQFLSFAQLIDPSKLSQIKHQTNDLEEKLKKKFNSPGRVVNIDPGIITQAALIMATTKNFAHRIPLQDGIYGHLEFLFRRQAIRTLEWTYPDFRQETYHAFFLEVRKIYLRQLASFLIDKCQK
ncbi:MAG: DUF4416 family protein [Candidatus Aminicenantes bacterium]|nr:DUF4416 family protein [Candidatus Aminicenantes bacterium]